MKRIIFALLTLIISISGFQAFAETKTDPAVHLKWLGGPTMLVSFNGFQFLTDPMLGSGEKAFLMGDPNEMFDLKKGPNIIYHKRLSPVPDISLKNVDLVVLSHAHEDHFDQEAEKQIEKNMSLLIPSADKKKISDKGFQNLKTLDWGEKVTFKAGKGSVTFTATKAHHSAHPEIDPILGKGNGYWIEFKEELWRKTLYWTGDTLPTDDVLAEIKNLGPLDILVPHMGRVGTSGPLGLISMGSEEAVKMAKELTPRTVLPIHHSTYSLYLEPIEILIRQAKGEPFDLDLLSVGSSIWYK